jgi:hypothetical protein
VSFLDGEELLHVPAFTEHVREAPAGILHEVHPQELRDPQPRAKECGDQRVVAHALMRPVRFSHAQRLRGREEPQLLEAAQALPLGLLFFRGLDAIGWAP